MGIEKRRKKRIPKRVTVRYGEHEFSRAGIIEDVSISGAFIVAQYLPAIGTRVHVQLMVGPQEFVFLEGEVKRHKVVPQHLRQFEKGGFGVHFLTPAELMAEVAPKLKAMGVAAEEGESPPAQTKPPAAAPAPEPRFVLTYADAAELKRAWNHELRFGGVSVRTEQAVPRDTTVAVHLRLGFAGGQELVFSARVAQVLAGSFKGLSLAFHNRVVVERSLLPFVG